MSRPKRKTNTREVFELHDKGWTLGKIAAHFKCSKPNICRMLKRVYPDPEPEYLQKLTERQRNFVRAKISGKSNTQAAMETCDVKDRSVARVVGFDLAHHPDVDKAIQEILQEEGLTKRYRVRRLKSHVDHRSPDISLKALDQSWKLDGAYLEKHLVATVNFGDLFKSFEDVKEAKRKLEEELGIIDVATKEKEEKPSEQEKPVLDPSFK